MRNLTREKKSNGADDNQEKIDAFLGRDKYENDSVTQTKFDEAMVDFFADSFVPFYVAGKESFRNVIKVSNRRIYSQASYNLF